MNSDNGHYNNQYSNIEVESTTINAKEIFWKYFQYWWLFVLVVGLSLTAAWLYLRYKKPVYSVTSTLLIRDDNANRPGGGMNSQDMFSDFSLFQSSLNKQNEMLILTSRTMMERVVKTLGLQKKYSVVGNIKVVDIFPDQPFELEIIHLRDSSNAFSLNINFSADWSKFRIGEDSKEWLVNETIKIPQGEFRINPHHTIYSNREFRNYIVEWKPGEVAAIQYLGGLEVKPANDQSNVLSLTYVS